MAFPSVSSVTETQVSSASTTHDINMPASVDADDLLLVFIAFSLLPTPGTPSGWTLLREDGIFCTYAKKTDGTEGGTAVNFSTSSSCTAAAQCYRITNWYEDITNGVNIYYTSGSGANPDPPSLTTAWGSDDNLWIAACGGYNDDATVNAYPANYTNGYGTISGGGVNNGCEVGTARRENATDTEDPGTFTLSESETWRAHTIAIRPGSGGTTLTGTISESAAITDNAAAQATFGSSISESAAISDSDTAQAQFASSIAESAGISDLITALAEMQSLINESSAITDNIESQSTFASTITESVNITDLIETLATFQSIINESAAITDFLTAGATIISGTINEVAGISDSLSSLAQYISTISESAEINDNLTSLAIMLSSIAESATISEVATAIAEYQSSISESVSITDIVQVILSAIESEIIIRCFKKTDILTEQQKHEHVLTKIKKHIDIINQVKQGGDRCH
ncbi:MAG: hypothetical protein PVG39_02685 [Desulfobacteraceae bacterium]|jgi:hypothetical protein